ncbi:hypothetical protein V6N13_058329 [Hibiscus sabdariffa]
MNRNNCVFNRNYDSVDCILRHSFAWTRYYADASTLPPTSTCSKNNDIQWPIIALDGLCLNVDGGVSPSTRIGYIGGLMRDQEGGWLFSFHKSIGIVSPLYAELWAILTGLQFAWDKGIPSLRVQSNCKEALNLIQYRSAIHSSILLVQATTNLVRRYWSVHFQWVPREKKSYRPAYQTYSCSTVYNHHL